VLLAFVSIIDFITSWMDCRDCDEPCGLKFESNKIISARLTAAEQLTATRVRRGVVTQAREPTVSRQHCYNAGVAGVGAVGWCFERDSQIAQERLLRSQRYRQKESP
jgi:hypothetical protein